MCDCVKINRLKQESILTQNEWTMFVQNSIYKITPEYVRRVEEFVRIVRKCCIIDRCNNTEIILGPTVLNELKDITKIGKFNVETTKVYVPTQRFSYWLNHLLTRDDEYDSFIKEFN